MNWLLSFARFIFGLYIFLYALVHALIFWNPKMVNYLVFMNLVRNPFNNLSFPIAYNLTNVHNFYMDVEPNVKVGIWHFIPKPLKYNFEIDSKKSLPEHFATYFKNSDGRPIFIYSHGNDADRSNYRRIGICNKFTDMGYHVFAIDYRGYGDSTGTPSEDGVVKDVMSLYNFIKSYQNQSRIFLWGHSLGTGVTCHVAKILSEFNSPPQGVFLESPFKNMKQAAREYILSPLFYNNPWIISKSEEGLEKLNLRFDNAANIVKINSKIVIFHAADDWFIPQDRSKDLMEECQKNRPKSYPPVKLVEIHEDHKLGHNHIYTHEEIYPVIKKLVEEN